MSREAWVVHVRCLQIYGEVWWFFVGGEEEVRIFFKTYKLAIRMAHTDCQFIWFLWIVNPYVLNFFKNYNFLEFFIHLIHLQNLIIKQI